MSRNGYGHMVIDYYVERVREMRAKRHEVLSNLQTREAALAYRDHVREILASSFGPWPEKVPLNAQVTGVVQCEGYRIEKVRFDSRPNFTVTANLYVPDGLTGPAPAVLALCGHANNGKACDTYQEFPIRLAHNGFVTLLVDPIHQGERNQYATLTKPLGMGENLCGAHNVMGKQLELVGEYFGAWRVWDARCGVDYLLSRPEVDARHVGVTGNSGGGTTTEWTFANEDRLTMAAPSCHVTSFLTNLENELPTDAEQCPPGVIGAGLEMVDLLIAQAPKPVRFLGQKYDFFERRGLKEAYEDLRKFYRLLDAEDEVELFFGPCPHGYSVHNQEAMVDFFRRKSGMTGEQVHWEPQVKDSASELNVLAEGNVVKAGSTPIYELIQGKAQALKAGWQLPADQASWRKALGELLQLPSDRSVPHYRIPRPLRLDGVIWARYAVETERLGMRAILKKRMTEHAERANMLEVEEEVHLFLPHVSSEDECQTAWVKGLNGGGLLYSLDVRGLGESMQEEEWDGGMLVPYGTDYMMHCFGLMLGESYLGRRVNDVLRTLDLLAANGAKRIHLHGHGQGALLALLGAMLHDRVVSVEEHEGLESFAACLTDVSDWPVASMIRGVLKQFDLPELRQALKEYLKTR